MRRECVTPINNLKQNIDSNCARSNILIPADKLRFGSRHRYSIGASRVALIADSCVLDFRAARHRKIVDDENVEINIFYGGIVSCLMPTAESLSFSLLFSFFFRLAFLH